MLVRSCFDLRLKGTIPAVQRSQWMVGKTPGGLRGIVTSARVCQITTPTFYFYGQENHLRSATLTLLDSSQSITPISKRVD